MLSSFLEPVEENARSSSRLLEPALSMLGKVETTSGWRTSRQHVFREKRGGGTSAWIAGFKKIGIY